MGDINSSPWEEFHFLTKISGGTFIKKGKKGRKITQIFINPPLKKRGRIRKDKNSDQKKMDFGVSLRKIRKFGFFI